MIDNPFRKILPKYVESLTEAYSRAGLTPNQITISAFLFAGLATFFTAQSMAWLALITWWAGRLLDGTDGIYARKTNQASEFGAFLDIVCDMASYGLMIIGFAVLHPHLSIQWMLMLFFYILCITSALSLGAIEQKLHLDTTDNRGIRLGAGLAEGGETGIAYSLFLLFPGQIGWLVNIWILILAATIGFRAALAYKTLAVARQKTML